MQSLSSRVTVILIIMCYYVFAKLFQVFRVFWVVARMIFCNFKLLNVF